MAILYLVKQHSFEILDANADYSTVLRLSFNQEYQNMIQVCIFMPFLHPETAKPINVQKTLPSKDQDTFIMN